MRSVGLSYWNWMPESDEEHRRHEIRSLELQIIDRERELSRLRAKLAEARR